MPSKIRQHCRLPILKSKLQWDEQACLREGAGWAWLPNLDSPESLCSLAPYHWHGVPVFVSVPAPVFLTMTTLVFSHNCHPSIFHDGLRISHKDHTIICHKCQFCVYHTMASSGNWKGLQLNCVICPASCNIFLLILIQKYWLCWQWNAPFSWMPTLSFCEETKA